MGSLVLTVLIGASLGAALGYYGQCSSGTCPLTANWKRGAIYGAVLGLLFHVAAGGSSSYQPPKHLKPVDEASFDAEVLQASQPVLVDFFATWCGPCKALAPVLDQVAEEFSGKVKFVQVNVDQSPALAQRFSVSGIPALLIFQNGKVINTSVGLVSAETLRALLLPLATNQPAAGPLALN